MASELERKHVDRRTVQRYIDRGTITQKEYEKELKSLPDQAGKFEVIKLEQPSSFGTPAR
jgi:hypothetical protein